MNLRQRIALKRQEAGQDNSQTTPVVEHIHQEQQDPDAIVLLISQIEVKGLGRRTFENLDTLAEDIKAKGQLQAIVVKQIEPNRYSLIAGERRFRAIIDVLKQDTILARVRRVEESDADIRFVQLSENAQRDDYLPLELANELADLKEQTGLTIEDIGKRIGKSKGFVSKFISLANAPDEVKQAIADGHVSATAWFNNKETVSSQLTTPAKNQPPQTKVRAATLTITLDAARDIAVILQKLAIVKELTEIDVDLSGKVTKKQVQAILGTRANEIASAL
jgi:ParB/RepB/Spo0J family partition protein